MDKISFEEIFQKYNKQIILLLVGLAFLGGGMFLVKSNFLKSPKIEVINDTAEVKGETSANEIIVEIAGAVEKPGVYHLPTSSRIDDLLIVAGGLSKDADRVWVDKTINKAAKLVDGQKIYIKSTSEQSIPASANTTGGGISVAQSSNMTDSKIININTATPNQLDTLPGIGPVYAQKIVDNRPYSDPKELLTKKVIPQSTYNKIKDSVAAY